MTDQKPKLTNSRSEAELQVLTSLLAVEIAVCRIIDRRLTRLQSGLAPTSAAKSALNRDFPTEHSMLSLLIPFNRWTSDLRSAIMLNMKVPGATRNGTRTFE